MSEPDIERQVRQQRHDIDALYELVERVDGKVDTLDTGLRRVDDKVDTLDTSFRRVDDKVDTLDTRVDSLEATVERRFDEVGLQLTEVLRRLAG